MFDVPVKEEGKRYVIFHLEEGKTLKVQRFTVTEDGTKTPYGEPFTVNQSLFEESEEGEFVYEAI